MIHLKQINKTYQGLAGSVHALINIDLEVAKGQSVVVIGKSGSGKSTLLNIISGIDRPESGELIIHGDVLNTFNENKLAKWRGENIGIVFQSHQLIPTLSALDNVLFPMDLVNIIPKKDRRHRSMELLGEVGLEKKGNKFPNELSGGEVQRVAIARALANDPQIIIADEPTGNLDSKTGEQIYQLFQRLSSRGKNLVVVTHENISNKVFDRVIHMQDGALSIS